MLPNHFVFSKPQWLFPTRVGLNGWLKWYLTGDIGNALCGHGAQVHDTMVHCRCDINAFIWSCCFVLYEKITLNSCIICPKIFTLSWHRFEFLRSNMYLLLYLGWKIELQCKEKMQCRMPWTAIMVLWLDNVRPPTRFLTAYPLEFGRVLCQNRMTERVQTSNLAKKPTDMECDWFSYTSADVQFPIRYNTCISANQENVDQILE